MPKALSTRESAFERLAPSVITNEPFLLASPASTSDNDVYED